MIPDNDWYGHKYILSLYCGRPLATAIFGSVMHGWVPELGDAGHRRVTSAPLFVWNEMLEADAVKTGVPNVRAIGAPFLYLAELLGQSGPSPTGRGTLCFPFTAQNATSSSKTIGGSSITSKPRNLDRTVSQSSTRTLRDRNTGSHTRRPVGVSLVSGIGATLSSSFVSMRSFCVIKW